MARNMYPGTCYVCGKYVPAGYGHFQRVRGGQGGNKWKIKCVECASGRRVTDKDPLVAYAREQRAKGHWYGKEAKHEDA